MRKALVIARRELTSMFGGPLAWILGAVFAVLTGYFFYSDLTFYVLFGGADLATGLWRYVFLDFRMVAMLVVPLITMRKSRNGSSERSSCCGRSPCAIARSWRASFSPRSSPMR